MELTVQLQVPRPLLHPVLLDLCQSAKQPILLTDWTFTFLFFHLYKDKCWHFHCWLPSLKEAEAHHTEEGGISGNKSTGCIVEEGGRAGTLIANRRRNAPSTLYCVPNHLSLRGQRPSCSGDNSIRLAFSGVSRDKAALITYTHTQRSIVCVRLSTI